MTMLLCAEYKNYIIIIIYLFKFLMDKDRREGNPDPDIYANRFYTDKFFREGGEL